MSANNKNIDYSIIIPIYNCEKYIEKCIISVINQKYENFELILINDGSTDKSFEVCKKYKENDNRIICISKNNSGVSDTRNVGIKNAKGKYILFLDSDDYIEENYLLCINKMITQYPDVQLINFGFYSEVYSIQGEVLSSDTVNAEFLYLKNKDEINKYLVYLWDKHMLYNIWNKVYIKDIIIKNKIRFPNYNFGEDMEFNKKYLDKISIFINSNQCFYHYIKERNGSLTTNYNDELFDIRVKEYIEFNQYFKYRGLKESDYLEFSSRRFIERVLGCVENICSCKIFFNEKRKKLWDIINNNYVRESLKYAKPRSKKIKIMLIPIKIKSAYLLLLMGNFISIIRRKMPGFFNKLKNNR